MFIKMESELDTSTWTELAKVHALRHPGWEMEGFPLDDVAFPCFLSVPPRLGPGCSRISQRTLAALQEKEPHSGHCRADLSVLVSNSWAGKRIPNSALHINANIRREKAV